MIDRGHPLPLTRQAKVAGISRGSVHYLPREVGEADLGLMRRIDALHLEHPFAGGPTPAVGTRGIRSTPTCCATWPSRSQTKLGHGHHLYNPDGAGLCVSGDGVELVQPAGAGVRARAPGLRWSMRTLRAAAAALRSRP